MTLDLRLVSWLCHEKLTLTTDRPVTIVCGENATGKSALLHGVEFVTLGTGRLRGITTKKELARLSVRDGDSSAEVSLRIPGTIDVGRSMERRGEQTVRLDDTDYQVTKGDAKLWTRLGLDPGQVRAALEADYLLGGDEAERRRVLFATAKTQPTVNDVALALVPSGLGDDDRARLAKQAIEDGFLAAQRTAEAERAARTRQLGEDTAEPPERIYKAAWTDREITLDTLVVAALVEREHDLEMRLGTAEREAGRSRGHLEADLSRARSDHAALIEEGNARTQEVEELAGAPAAYEQAQTFYNGLSRQAGQLGPQVDAWRAQERALNEGPIQKPKKCPAIPGEPACPMSKARLDAHQNKVAGLLEELERCIRRGAPEVEDLRRRVAEAEVHRNETKQRADRHREAEERLAEIGEELDAAEGRIAEAMAAIQALPEESEGPSPVDEIRERLLNLRTLIAAKKLYDRKQLAAQQSAVRRTGLQEARDAWDRAAKALAPGGIPLDLFNARLPDLQRHLDHFGVGPIRLTPAGELEAHVEGDWRSRVQLSESWRLRLSMAASHLVASAAGFPLLILDRFDYLDRVGRRDVLQGARRVAASYPGGVLILATLQRERPEPTGLPDVGTVWLRDGLAEPIG